MMKEGVEESYRLRANMLRQEAKIAEQLKSIEIDRLKRLGKAIRAANQIREYCAMCDLQFYGHLSTHRKSEGHLDLKKFLHPKCDECTTEFHNRTEFDDHLLSPNHMKTSKVPPSYKSEESRKNRLQILTEADEVQGLREEKPKKEKKEPAKEGEASTAEGEAPKTEEGATEAMETDAAVAQTAAEIKQEAEDAEDAENQNEQNDQPEFEPILDYNEGDEIGPEIENKIPKYNCKRQVGSNLVAKLVCFECRLCNKYFDTEITAEIHSRTYNHHRLFVKFLNEKANETKIAQKRAAAAAEETERLKRVKLETETEAPAAEVVPKSELYDPTEATGEDEPKENGATESTDVPMTDATAPATVVAPVAAEEKAPETEAKPAEEKPTDMVVEEVPSTPTAAPAATPVATPAATPVATPAVAVTPAQVPVQATVPVTVQPAVVPTTPVQPTPVQATTPVVQSPAQNNQQNNNQQNNQQQQNNTTPNNTPNKPFNNNRGRGRNNNNNRRSGRYGGRY